MADIHIEPTIAVPLRTDDDGNIRVGGTRVTLDTIIHSYQRGDTAEIIHVGFPTLKLVDIFAVITYYLANREAVDAYLHKQEAEAERRRVEWEKQNPPDEALRARLRLARERNQEQP